MKPGSVIPKPRLTTQHDLRHISWEQLPVQYRNYWAAREPNRETQWSDWKTWDNQKWLLREWRKFWSQQIAQAKMKLARAKRVRTLPLSRIRLDFQPAENLIEETVQRYVERFQRGKSVPLLRVRFDESSYFLEDGFHRVEAAKRCGVKRLRAEILAGTLADMEAEFRDYLKRLRERLQSENV